jgi:pimeloyl-ACP methyl ester carboxylesterase
MSIATSRDSTSISYDREGDGPPVILVGGGLVDRSENAPVASELARRFTAYNYDRRGRGASTDVLPYHLDRELEDIDALIASAGGSAHLYGVSSGGALALEAAAAGLAIDRVAVYEVPYCTVGDMPQRWRHYVEELATTLGDGRRGDAIALFMRLVGTPEDVIEGMRDAPFWPALEDTAHTLAYEAACLGDGQPPVARLAQITSPTLVLTGGAGPAGEAAGLPADFYADPADKIEAAVPGASREILDGQGHVADAEAVAAVLERSFTAP